MMCYAFTHDIASDVAGSFQFNLPHKMLLLGLIQPRNQEGLNKKEIQLNLRNIFSLFIFNEVYLFP